MQPTKIILCADDYALSAPVSAGIIELVKMERLSAVGCMTEAPFWQDKRNTLPELRDRIDIGLHFNLTQGFGAPKQSLQQILRGALLGTLVERHIENTLHDQLDRFESVMGEAPDFVDGHQHVHVFPRIRNIVLQTLARRYRHRRPWLRQVNPDLRFGPDWHKRLLLAALDTHFAHRAQQLGFACNSHFAGIYSLRSDANFGRLMQQWLLHAQPGELLMCHPGYASDATTTDAAKANPLFPADMIASTRPLELAWLAGAEFANLLQTRRVQLARFRDAVATDPALS